DQSPLHAVIDIGELDPAVADGAAAEVVEDLVPIADGLGEGVGAALQQALIAVEVADELRFRRQEVVGVDESADGGGQAGGDAAGGQECDLHGVVVNGLRNGKKKTWMEGSTGESAEQESRRGARSGG